MRHIKMYESWLNEAERVMLDLILSKGLSKAKETVNTNLIELSTYGKIFESQIRKNLDIFRNTYASSSIWTSLSTKPGIETAINNFKELFFISYGGTDQFNSISTGFTVKVNNALEFAENDFFEGITIDNKLWRSKQAVELKNIIINGNEELAKGLASSIILLDLATAITNGLYYMSKSITLKQWGEKTNVNLGSLLNQTLIGNLTDYDNIAILGKDSNMFTSLKDVYTRPYNNRIRGEWKGYDIVYNFTQFIPYVKKMTADFLIDQMQYGQYNQMQPPSEFFAPLYIGYYMSNDANYSIDKAVEFMKAGGPNLLQSAISKFS